MFRQTIFRGLSRLLLLSLVLTIRIEICAQDAHLLSSAASEDSPAAPHHEATFPSGESSLPAGKTSQAKLSRWVEVQVATIFVRYHFVENSAGLTTANQVQHKESFKARFKFDREGKYSLNAGVFSGRNFIATWNNTGWGTGTGQSNLALKQLFFAAAPVNGIEVQAGGLYVVRGESTEITSYDDDGFIVGERISLKRPGKFFFDEISVTYAYLGDTNTPNLNKRYHRLKESNYHQFLVQKKLNPQIAVSADYTFEAGRDTFREAIRANIPRFHLLDSIRFENYQRLSNYHNSGRAYGFALHGEKLFFQRLTLGGGYAQIDPRYGGLNADRFGSGKRLFLMTSLRLSPEFSLTTYATRAIANDVPVTQRTRVDLVLNYNLLQTLKHTGLF